MSTIGGLLLPNFQPLDYGRAMTQGINAASGILNNETALFALQDAKRQQAAQAQAEAAQAQSILGQMGAGGGSVPMTQQSVMPGQPPGAPAVVSGGQDLSRFAGGSAPPGMPQAVQGDPIEALLQKNPGAGLQALDLQAKRQTQQLTLKARIADYVGSVLQGAREDSWEEARKEVARVAPEWARALPPTYSAAAVQPYIDRALSVKEQQVIQIEGIKADTERMNALVGMRKAGQPQKVDYGYGPEMDAALDARFGDEIRRSGQPPTQPMVEQATQDVDARHIKRSVETFRQTAPDRAEIARQTGTAAQGEKPLEGPERIRINAFTQAEDIATQLSNEFTKDERARFVGMGGFRMNARQLAQLATDATSGKADPKFARFAALLAIAQAEAFSEGGKTLTDNEKDVVFGYIPTGKEMSAEAFEQKLTLAQQRLPALLDREIKLATAPRRELPGMRERGELSGKERLNPRAPARRPVAEMSQQDMLARREQLLGKR